MIEQTPVFLAFFRRLGAPRTEAEDLVQEVFLKMFRHAPSYEPTGRIQAFAFRIARNAWIDRKRRGAVRPLRALGEDADEVKPFDLATPEPSPDAQAQSREEGGRVTAALSQLSEAHRLVFELGVVQELPYSEISRLLEIPEGTVKSRMFNAVRRLREFLEETDPGGGRA